MTESNQSAGGEISSLQDGCMLEGAASGRGFLNGREGGKVISAGEKAAAHRGASSSASTATYRDFNVTFARRREEGLCIRCGKRPPEEGKTLCRECLDLAAKKRRDYVSASVAAGRCPLCGGLLKGKFKTCRSCREEIGERRRKAAEERRKKGICPDCGGPVEEGRVRCRSCLDAAAKKHLERSRAFRAQGLCAICGDPVEPGRTRCAACRAKARVQYVKNRTERWRRMHGHAPENGFVPAQDGRED